MSKKITIAIDAMGGDNSPSKSVKGVGLFLSKNKFKNDFMINLFGDEKQISKVLNENKDPSIKKHNESGIEARPIWKLCHEQKYLKHFEVTEITNAIEQVNSCICLPSSIGLNEEDIKFISGVINE